MVEIAQQRVERVPGQDVVEAVGVLADAAVDVRHGAPAVPREFARDVFDVLGVETADLSPALERLLVGRVADHLQG